MESRTLSIISCVLRFHKFCEVLDLLVLCMVLSIYNVNLSLVHSVAYYSNGWPLFFYESGEH